MIDFPASIERAYQDGVRVFVEVGPGQLVLAVDRSDSRQPSRIWRVRHAGPKAIRFWSFLTCSAD